MNLLWSWIEFLRTYKALKPLFRHLTPTYFLSTPAMLGTWKHSGPILNPVNQNLWLCLSVFYDILRLRYWDFWISAHNQKTDSFLKVSFRHGHKKLLQARFKMPVLNSFSWLKITSNCEAQWMSPQDVFKFFKCSA